MTSSRLTPPPSSTSPNLGLPSSSIHSETAWPVTVLLVPGRPTVGAVVLIGLGHLLGLLPVFVGDLGLLGELLPVGVVGLLADVLLVVSHAHGCPKV